MGCLRFSFLLVCVGIWGVCGSGDDDDDQLGQNFAGTWINRDETPYSVILHVCVETEEGFGTETVTILNARLDDLEKGEVVFLHAELYEVHEDHEKIEEFRGNFFSAGYPIFSGPGYPRMENCYHHQFRWRDRKLVFRCNYDDYLEIKVKRLSDEELHGTECFQLGHDLLEGTYESHSGIQLDICDDRTLASAEPFRIRLSQTWVDRVTQDRDSPIFDVIEESSEGYLESAAFVNGRVASGQFYDNAGNKSDEGLFVLLLRMEEGIVVIIDELEFFAEFTNHTTVEECVANEDNAPLITGTYQSPMTNLPEVFVCEYGEYISVMYGYYGFFLGKYSSERGGYDCVWAQSGFPVTNILGAAFLKFNSEGIEGDGLSDDNTYSISLTRISRGQPPHDLCFYDTLHALSHEGELNGVWGASTSDTGHHTRSSSSEEIGFYLCTFDDETLYNASYGINDNHGGGFEEGALHSLFQVSSGIFYEPGDTRGYSLSVAAGEETMYNVYLYDDELRGFYQGFNKPRYGIYKYHKESSSVLLEDCNAYDPSIVDEHAGSGVLRVFLPSIGLIVYLSFFL